MTTAHPKRIKFCAFCKSWDGNADLTLIGSTKTTTGLEVICVRDNSQYELKKKVSNEDFEALNIDKIAPFFLWNYKILPQ